MGRGRAPDRTVLVTGLPQFTTRRLLQHAAEREPGAVFYLLVPERAVPAARKLVASLPGRRDRYRILEGDPRKIDLGLSGAEWRALTEEVQVIHHMAAVYDPGVDRAVAEAVNVRGTAEVLELAGQARRLERLVFYSSVSVSGDYRGVWTEEDLDRGQRHDNLYAETKHRAEKLLRRRGAGLPITVLRAPVVVGDSRTGEIDRFDGPYQLMLLFIALPVDLGLILPGRAERLVNLVPVDFFVEAAHAIASHPESAGRTFHVVDPEPLPMARVFEQVALASQRKVPRGYVPAKLSRALLRTPGFERFADSPMAALDLFTADVVYSSAGAQELLREAGVRCPRLPDYVDNLVAFLRQRIAEEGSRRGEEEVYDPLW